MDLWQLKVFTSVIDQKSFSRAGEMINLSQPTVSSHIKELEHYFDCRLIDRMGREALPTSAGKLLYTYAGKLLALKAEAESAMSDFLGTKKGHMIFGGSNIPTAFILPKLIGPFKKDYPHISVTLVTGNTSQIIERIIRGDLEAGMVGAKVEDPQVRQEMLIRDEMKLVVPGDHKWADQEVIDYDALLDEPFITRESGSGTWGSISKSIGEAGFKDKGRFNVSVTMGSTAAVIQGILNHAGVSILSTIAVEDEIRSGRLKALNVAGLDLNRCFYLTTHSRRVGSPITEAFIAFMKQHLT